MEAIQQYGVVFGSVLFIIGASLISYLSFYPNKSKIDKKKGIKSLKRISKNQTESTKSKHVTPDSSSKSSNKYKGYSTDSTGKIR